jgi:hypothetical protein
MTDSEIQCLKDNVDKLVEIETSQGEKLVAKVLFVSHSDEYDEHDLLYEFVSTSTPEFYAQFENPGGFVLDFDKILTVKPHPKLGARG